MSILTRLRITLFITSKEFFKELPASPKLLRAIPNKMEKTIFNIVSTLMDEPLENISIDTGPSTISNWDSLRHMKLILATEEEFNIIFPDQALI